MPDLIDLTGLSDGDSDRQPPRKRQRRDEREDSADVLVVEEETVPGGVEGAADADERELGEDEDLVVLRVQGEIWNQDLAHTRDTCGAHAFSRQACAANAVHCSKCFCYICDCPATDCKSWGSGLSRHDHANAHAADPLYTQLRKAKRELPASAAPAARPASASALPFLERQRHQVQAREWQRQQARQQRQSALQVELARAREEERQRERQQAQIVRAAPWGPPPAPYVPPCNLVAIPDPARNPDLLELARIELRCKAMGANTLAQLRRRLVPHGFYIPVNPRNQSYGDKLCIDNLMEKKWEAGKMVPAHLKLSKLQLPASVVEPSAERVRTATVYHYDGRTMPTTVGVSVDKDATVQQILDAVAALVDLGPEECLLPASQSASHLSYTSCELTLKITDVQARQLNLALYRVPKPAEGGGPNSPSYALIYHRKRDSPESYNIQAAGAYTIVPLGAAFANGGKAAERAILGRVLDALGPMRKPDVPASQVTVSRLQAAGMQLHRCGSYGATYVSQNTSDSAFANSRPYASMSRYGETTFRNGILFLRLDWPTEQLEHFDLEAWKQPQVHESATPEALKQTMEIMEAADKYAQQRNKAKSLPYSMMDELKSRSQSREPGVAGYSAQAGLVSPLVRCSLELRPASSAADERRGTLVVRVFVWRGQQGEAHESFFKAADEWEGAAAASRRNRRYQMYMHIEPSVLTNPLRCTMECMLWGDGSFKAMQQRIQEWTAMDLPSKRSLVGLMEVMERGEYTQAQQPEGLTVTMRPYQLQSLQFMLDCEHGEGGFRRLFWLPLSSVGGERYWYSPLLGRAAFEVPSQPWGGFCCEEMGLGKTVITLALILANPAPLPGAAATAADSSRRQGGASSCGKAPLRMETENGLIKSRATLVVCAVSLVGQWMAEAEAKLGGSLRIHMYHGQSRIKDAARLATEFDLVVTTYATLNSDFASGGGRILTKGKGKGKAAAAAAASSSSAGRRISFPPLGSIKWHRLICDEAHTVKNAGVGHSRACAALEADRRWMVTGTPINTDIHDLFGQFAVLRMSPFDNKNFFDRVVRSAYGTRSDFSSGCPALIYTLGQCMIRHTKKQVLGGEEVLSLPAKTEETVAVVLTEEEQKMYREAHKRSKDLFLQYQQAGHAFISKHLLQIMSLLLPMRRICSGGRLSERDLQVNDPLFGPGGTLYAAAAVAAAGAMLRQQEADASLVAPEEECSICLDTYETPAVTPCSHWFCRECILGVLQANPKCPLCRALITADQVRSGVTAAEAAALAVETAAVKAADAKGKGKAAAEEEPEARRSCQQQQPGGLQSESKLQALLKELRAMRRRDPTAKALIFSQYVSTIEWLKTRLTEEGFGFRFISGSMPLKQRAKAINAFQQDPPTTVFLLSMRSGSVGINLTAANHVFLMEPALNSALEEQAIGRSWRMGQTRTVTIKKFYVKGSVEERIMEVVRKRQHAVAGASNAAQRAADSDSDGEGPSAMPPPRRTNVHMQDLAGSIKADKQLLRAGELEELFKDPEFTEVRVPEPPSEAEEEEEFQDPASDEEEEEDVAVATWAGTSTGGRQRAARHGGHGAPASRAKGRRRYSMPDSEEEEAAAEAGAYLQQRRMAGRQQRSLRKRRVINYAALSRGTNSEDEEEDEESDEEAESPQKQQQQQQPGAGKQVDRGRPSGSSIGGFGRLSSGLAAAWPASLHSQQQQQQDASGLMAAGRAAVVAHHPSRGSDKQPAAEGSDEMDWMQ